MEAASSWEAAELLGGVPSAAQRAEAQWDGSRSNVGKAMVVHSFWMFVGRCCFIFWQELTFIVVIA